MSRPTITFHNTETDEYLNREMNDDEFAQWEADVAAYEVKAQEEAAKKAKREAALAKLEALGLDADDLKALGL
jgi:hypothetical protein